MTNPAYIVQGLLVLALAAGWALHVHRLHRRLDRSRHDPLTGLWTRDGWTRRAERTIRRPRAAVLLADLDGFKAVNDVHGHAAGDAVLAAAGERLTVWCGAHGTAGRLGGDEFVAVVEDDGRLDDRLADLAELLRQPVEHQGVTLRVGASIGAARLATLPEPTLTAALKAADQAMYRAKGRTRRGRRLLLAPAFAVLRGLPQRLRLAA
ncbi:GGDEF domain-containing protein [Streptomyces sp. NBC_01433]|uniref:GGDEF domain-containing protein n=1 Tax=Streptomyces sp. NBC_01433 TaxID=2903864 RepID=UPI002256743B|nr:GGDEF domain-containing protein [Streptomyces sp. NBC_01433]MCX4682585.1 GGDEF domain-containing protein [Streptomyces sp. NBC_01433]